MFPSVYKELSICLCLAVTGSFSCLVLADPAYPPFYRQLHPSTLSHSPGDNYSGRSHSASSYPLSSHSGGAAHSDLMASDGRYLADSFQQERSVMLSSQESPNYLFNYLWVQQHQLDYDHHEGSAALGKLVRLGLKSFYQQYRGNSGSIQPGTGEDSLVSELGGVDYKLRLNGSKVSLGIDYNF